jgi:hypothetical protein
MITSENPRMNSFKTEAIHSMVLGIAIVVGLFILGSAVLALLAWLGSLLG